ncbi:thiol reductant ABC exporter subunit CydC [Salinisphaera orenii]|uniref:thiol reductant ABC exporter subunit CydC n=1 Tax=Salinisphaera orenii TaxID=856731 RepID=UPI0013A60F82
MNDLAWWLRLGRPYAGRFALGVAASVATVVASMALLAISGWFITGMALAGAAGSTFNYFLPAAIIRGLAMTRTGGRYLERLVNHDATLALLTGLRVWFYRQVEPLSPATLAEQRGGDLLARIRADIDTLDQVYLRLFVPLVVGGLCVALAVGVLAFYSGWLALAVGGCLVAAGLVMPAMIERAGRGPGWAGVELAGRLRAGVADYVDGLGELIVFGAAEPVRDRLGDMTDRWLGEQRRLARLSGLSDAGLLVLTQAAVLATAGLGAWLVQSGSVAPAEFAGGVLWVLGSFEAVTPMPAAWQAVGELRAASARLRAFEQQPPAVAEPDAPAPMPATGRIVFDDVGVRRPDDAGWAVRGVGFTIEPGERLAIAGVSGAGKSTLLALIERLIDCDQGTLSWGDRPISAYRAADVRSRLSAVPQRVHLFDTTIAENLRLAAPAADQAALERAATLAGIDTEIDTMPDGYATRVGEGGTRLSGGQRRRLGMARAVLADAPLWLLDEPTEGIDDAAADRLWNTLDCTIGPRTLVVATHNADWLRRVDRAVVLEHGAVVAVGTPAELAKTSDAYRRLLAGSGRPGEAIDPAIDPDQSSTGDPALDCAHAI